MNRNLITLGVTALLCLVGCQSGQGNGALLGAGLGALAGQAIGGDTKATLIGTGVGALAGSIFGAEADAQARNRRQVFRHDDGSFTTRRTNTRRVLNPDGTYTVIGEETTVSEQTQDGYQGLP